MASIDSVAPTLSQAPLTAPDPGRHRLRERKRRLAHNIRQGLLALTLIATAGAAVLALRPRPVPVDLANVVQGALSVVIQESGVTRVKDRYEVSAPVTGRLSRLALDVGDTVKEGDPLAEIAPALSPLLDNRTRAEAEARL